MKSIAINQWERKEHFNFFHQMDYPQFNVCANIDVTHFLNFVQTNKLPFYYAMIHAATLAVNQTDNLRYRIRGEEVILHERIHPSFTDMAEDSDLFKLVTVEMKDDILEFARYAEEKSLQQKEYFALNELIGRDDLIYITCLPWISFTHLSHTISLNKNDSAPRISWGKYFGEKDRVLLPFSVQVNHALADGIHIAQYLSKLQSHLDNL